MQTAKARETSSSLALKFLITMYTSFLYNLNGGTKWADTTAMKRKKIDEFEVFKLLLKVQCPPPGYKRILYQIVVDVKFDLRKVRLVAGG